MSETQHSTTESEGWKSAPTHFLSRPTTSSDGSVYKAGSRAEYRKA